MMPIGGSDEDLRPPHGVWSLPTWGSFTPVRPIGFPSDEDGLLMVSSPPSLAVTPTSPVVSTFSSDSMDDLSYKNTSSANSWNDIYMNQYPYLTGDKDPELDVYYTLKNSRGCQAEYSRKVFLGGLPDGIKSEQIRAFFLKFGSVSVDWPHRNQAYNKTPKGYAFLIFGNTDSVRDLVGECSMSTGGKFCIRMSEETGHQGKNIQVRPWTNKDRTWISPGLDPNFSTRYSIFVGAVPRTTTAVELAHVIQSAFGSVVIVNIEVDFDTEYPKGAARVVFSERDAYSNAIAKRHLTFFGSEVNKEMEMKPFLEECMNCESCFSKSARHFCSELRCLAYYCDKCWQLRHNSLETHDHKPMSKGSFFGNKITNWGWANSEEMSDMKHVFHEYKTEEYTGVPDRSSVLLNGTATDQNRPPCSSLRNSYQGYNGHMDFTHASIEYSRKVFVGGLPEGADANCIRGFFSAFGSVAVDWPNRDRTIQVPRAGYAFVTFCSVNSVRSLISQCSTTLGKLTLRVNFQNGDKSVQIRPWCKNQKVWKANGTPNSEINYRFSIFLGGVPRTSTAGELADCLRAYIGNVVLLSVEVDSDTDYPKGAARAVFENRCAYVRAISCGFIIVTSADQHKKVEIKPFLEDVMRCDDCNTNHTRTFCPDLSCLRYLCDICWNLAHSSLNYQLHRPINRGQKGCSQTRREPRSPPLRFFDVSPSTLGITGASEDPWNQSNNAFRQPLPDYGSSLPVLSTVRKDFGPIGSRKSSTSS